MTAIMLHTKPGGLGGWHRADHKSPPPSGYQADHRDPPSLVEGVSCTLDTGRVPSCNPMHAAELVGRGMPHDWAGRKLLCGGGMARKPICPTPPSPSLVAVLGGGFGLGLPYLLCRGGGGPNPTYMAQNDPHVALIILTTHLWGKFFE